MVAARRRHDRRAAAAPGRGAPPSRHDPAGTAAPRRAQARHDAPTHRRAQARPAPTHRRTQARHDAPTHRRTQARLGVRARDDPRPPLEAPQRARPLGARGRRAAADRARRAAVRPELPGRRLLPEHDGMGGGGAARRARAAHRARDPAVRRHLDRLPRRGRGTGIARALDARLERVVGRSGAGARRARPHAAVRRRLRALRRARPHDAASALDGPRDRGGGGGGLRVRADHAPAAGRLADRADPRRRSPELSADVLERARAAGVDRARPVLRADLRRPRVAHRARAVGGRAAGRRGHAAADVLARFDRGRDRRDRGGGRSSDDRARCPAG